MNTPESNRFAPPNALVDEPLALDDTPQLATRSARLGAVMVDGVFGGILLVAALVPLYGMRALPQASRTPTDYLGGLAVYYGLYFVIQAWVLHGSGQTLGKKALGLRIVRADGSPASFGRLLARLLVPFVSLVPYAGKLFTAVDALFIFGAARRCLHDRIVDTIVVTAASSPRASRQGTDSAPLRTANF